MHSRIRQRKLNTKAPLRIIREHEIEETADDEAQRHIPQVETGVEKGEEIEYHLQAVIHAANAATLGAKAKQSYIPTPEATKAKGVKYDELYPRSFKPPATYIRFSSTVEDCTGVSYCMDETDAEFLSRLNDGKDVHGKTFKSQAGQCSEDVLEEVMNFLEETSQRLQPYAALDSAPPLPSFEEMEQHQDELNSSSSSSFLKPIYQYWVQQKRNRPLMPAIKVRVLDTGSEADDADPYVCFRRREVRQTRKTRGRDAQVVEKLKKLRIELEQARGLVQMVRQREELNKLSLEVNRDVFEKRRKLKEVKITRNIVGEKGEDEELLVNQKPMPKPKLRQDTNQQRPATIRIRSLGDRSAPENDLISLADLQAESEAHVINVVESKKQQHKRWNDHWQDKTWNPITPPPELEDEPSKWAPLLPSTGDYPTPPPSLPSRSSQEKDGDVEMPDRPEDDTTAGAETKFKLFVPPPYSVEIDGQGMANYFDLVHRPKLYRPDPSHDSNPACRIRFGRGGRRHLEQRSRRPRAVISRGVVSDAESDDDAVMYYPASDNKIFDQRCSYNGRPRSDESRRQQAEQYAMAAAAQAASASHHTQASQSQGSSGGSR